MLLWYLSAWALVSKNLQFQLTSSFVHKAGQSEVDTDVSAGNLKKIASLLYIHARHPPRGSPTGWDCGTDTNRIMYSKCWFTSTFPPQGHYTDSGSSRSSVRLISPRLYSPALTERAKKSQVKRLEKVSPNLMDMKPRKLPLACFPGSHEMSTYPFSLWLRNSKDSIGICCTSILMNR